MPGDGSRGSQTRITREGQRKYKGTPVWACAVMARSGGVRRTCTWQNFFLIGHQEYQHWQGRPDIVKLPQGYQGKPDHWVREARPVDAIHSVPTVTVPSIYRSCFSSFMSWLPGPRSLVTCFFSVLTLISEALRPQIQLYALTDISSALLLVALSGSSKRGLGGSPSTPQFPWATFLRVCQ